MKNRSQRWKRNEKLIQMLKKEFKRREKLFIQMVACPHQFRFKTLKHLPLNKRSRPKSWKPKTLRLKTANNHQEFKFYNEVDLMHGSWLSKIKTKKINNHECDIVSTLSEMQRAESMLIGDLQASIEFFQKNELPSVHLVSNLDTKRFELSKKSTPISFGA